MLPGNHSPSYDLTGSINKGSKAFIKGRANEERMEASIGDWAVPGRGSAR